MSNAKPMDVDRQRENYLRQSGRLTARQERAHGRARTRERYAPTSQATGERVRKPIAVAGRRLPRHQRVELSGSLVRYQARYCSPCGQHRRPRLHAIPLVRSA